MKEITEFIASRTDIIPKEESSEHRKMVPKGI
jgi:hypothetical protein